MPDALSDREKTDWNDILQVKGLEALKHDLGLSLRQRLTRQDAIESAKLMPINRSNLDEKTDEISPNYDIAKRRHNSVYFEEGRHYYTLSEGKSTTDISVITEGIETALLLKEVMPNTQIIAISSKEYIGKIDLEALYDTVIIALNNDGILPSEDRIIQQALTRLVDEKEEVYTIMPEDIEGKDKVDFNDILTDQGRDKLYDSIMDSMERVLPEATSKALEIDAEKTDNLSNKTPQKAPDNGDKNTPEMAHENEEKTAEKLQDIEREIY